jgi:hypothetical protein
MAERPVFLPSTDPHRLVDEIFFPLHWHSGFAAIQKDKNICELHSAASAAGFAPLLEVSTKSVKKSGRHLSAFHLTVKSERHGEILLECAFQGSKVFQFGGPFTDLYTAEARNAKRDPRLKSSGALTGFEYDGKSFPLEPKTLFYDWIYLNSIYEHREWISKLNAYVGFTDVEFNPYKSVNCQARSIALFLALYNRQMLDSAVYSAESFAQILSDFDYHPTLRASSERQSKLFAVAPHSPSTRLPLR